MALYSPELDSATKIRALRSDFDDDGKMSPDYNQVMFEDKSARANALESTAGPGPTQAEYDKLQHADSPYRLGGNVEEALQDQEAQRCRHPAEV